MAKNSDFISEEFMALPFFFFLEDCMRVYVTVREGEYPEDGYIIDKLFTNYKDAQDSLLKQGYRILDEEDELYQDNERKDGCKYARIYHRSL